MLPNKSFYLIRHGESTANVRNITAGGLFDSPLSRLGHEQGQALAPLLKHLEARPTHLYHSPLIRAHQTAEYFNETLQLPAEIHDDLREQDMGGWDGLPWADVQPMLQQKEVPPGGESEGAFAMRIRRVLNSILNNCAGLPMIVAHGGLFHAIGVLHDHTVTHVHNCHLHFFEPDGSYARFPWRVSAFDIEGDRLVRNAAPFCASVATVAAE